MHDVFYFTDVHGQMQLFTAMINWAKEQDNKAIIIYGGDACDRGPHGYTIMNQLLEDPQIIYIKGNHEDLFVKAAHALHKMYPERMWTYDEAKTLISKALTDNEDIYLHIANGGLITLADWMMNGMDMEFVDQIDDLPIIWRWNNYDFSHAGGSPIAFEEIIKAIDNNEEPTPWDIKSMIWDRNCIQMGWLKNRICVHGHTPAILLPAAFYGRDKNEAKIHPAIWQGITQKKRFSGKKIDMDTGMTWSGRAWILNCQTGIMTSFFDTDIGKEDIAHNISIGFENIKI